MKHIFFLSLLLIPIFAFAQFPANPRKMVLGYQTTADGIIYRASGTPAYTPSDANDTRAYINTDNGDLYVYQGGWILIASNSIVADSMAVIRNLIGSSVGSQSDTTVIYCPSHGLTLSSFVGEVAGLQDDCTLSDAAASSTLQTRYIINSFHPDSLTIQISGLVYKPAHGLTPGTQYFLQDAPSNGDNGTTAGTVESKTFVVFDDNYLHLVDPSASGENLEIPVINIPAAAFSVYGTDAKAPNDTAVQNIAEIYDAAELIRNGSYLIAYNSSISDNEIYRNNADGSSTPFHVWQWNGTKVTRLSSRPVAISTQDTLYGSSGILPLDTIVPAGSAPTTSEVVTWLTNNYNNNGLRLPNGSIVYYEGTGSTSEPELSWVIMDDLSASGGTNFSRIVKAIKYAGQTLSKPTTDSITIEGGNTIVDRSIMQELEVGDVTQSAGDNTWTIRDLDILDWQQKQFPTTSYGQWYIDFGQSGRTFMLHNATTSRYAQLNIQTHASRIFDQYVPGLTTSSINIDARPNAVSRWSKIDNGSGDDLGGRIQLSQHGIYTILQPHGYDNTLADTLHYFGIGTNKLIGQDTLVDNKRFVVGKEGISYRYNYLEIDMSDTTQNSVSLYDGLYSFENSTPPGDSSMMYFSAAGVPGWLEPGDIRTGSGGSGTTEAADGVTILGDGGSGTEFTVDTTLIATTQAVIDSIAALGGSGDVTGPGASTDNSVVRFDGTGGKTLQNSVATIDDDGKFDIQLSEQASTREIGLNIQLNGTEDKFQVANLTSADGEFIPSFIGFNEQPGRTRLQFAGYMESTDDNSSGEAVIDFRVSRVVDGVDPANSSKSAVQNQNLFHFRNHATYVATVNSTGEWNIGEGVSTSSFPASLNITGSTGVRAEEFTSTDGEYKLNSAGDLKMKSGAGTPESVVSASTGSTYHDTSGGNLYKKGSGTGSTGWIEIVGKISGSTNQLAKYDANGDIQFSSITDNGSTVAFGTKITTALGSEAAPVIAPTSDTNTGIFYPSADAVAISTGGSERIRINSSGGVIILSTIWRDSGETIGDFVGTGDPEGSVSASVGSVFRRTDGGSSTTLYVKESGTGNTGWVAK